VVLQKRHGYTTHGPDIETAVYRALYTIVNASVQTKATSLANAISAKPISALSAREAQDCRKMTEATQDKAWRLWVREVETSPLYRNALKRKL
jgi:ribulose-5-phosphate 4-epimerase/fuculose-1-phosphate aldolase